MVFSEPVAGFSGADVDLSQSTAAGTLAAKVTGQGAEYLVAVSGMTGSGWVIATIPAGAAQDPAGNMSSASTSPIDNNVWYGTPFEGHYDFGTRTSPVAQGYTRVTDKTAYSAAPGYGWQSGRIYSADRGKRSSNLDRDLNYTQRGTFAVDVPNGAYRVTMRLGDMAAARDRMGVSLEGVSAEPLSTKAGQVVAREYVVWVDDGQLTVDLQDWGGKDKNVSITALDVLAVGRDDWQAPTVTIRPAAGQANPAIDAPIVFTAVFSEPVAGFTKDDIDLSQSTAAGALVAEVAGRVKEYRVAVSGMTGSGTVVAAIRPGAARDMSGNAIGPAASDPVAYYHLVRQFDFGTPGSMLQRGYTRVSEKAKYSANQGYGWSGTNGEKVTSADRRTGSALDRDLILTSDATFLVDVPNGTYLAELRLGDLGPLVHDRMGIFLEGNLVDTVTTPKKKVVTRIHNVVVSDGQLTLGLQDLGGTDKHTAIDYLRIRRIE